MCGIAGWVDLKNDISTQGEKICAMTRTLTPRGPDDSGFFITQHALLGHRRLSVVDLVGGAQPMSRTLAGRTCTVIYNGELYNTEDIRSELRSLGHAFIGHSDTEVLLLAYMQWGEACLKRFNGIFAFAIWDDAAESVFLARDRFGVKPLFYAFREGGLIFASELKAMLAHPLVKAELAADGLAEIFALSPSHTPGHGIYKDVYELEGGSCLLFNAVEFDPHPHPYWQLECRPHTDSLEETIEKVRFLVQDTVVRQLVSDVPVCTFLSGGLDSSAITAIAAGHFREHSLGQLHTYSVDYQGNAQNFKPSHFQPDPDSRWVGFMSDRFHTIHHDYVIDGAKPLADALEDAALARDLPGMADVDSSLLLFCREIKRSHVVALSGECADEVFGGYPWFHDVDVKRDTFPWMQGFALRRSIMSQDLAEFIKPDEYVSMRYQESVGRSPTLPGEDPLEAKRREMFYLNLQWFMAMLLERKDRMSMATGLEVRVPFCDHRLAEYVWNIPWEMKALHGREKGVLREALRGLLPEEIIQRKKSPYPKTHDPAYESLVKARLKDILSGSSPLLKLIDVEEVRRLLDTPADLGRPWFGQLMALPQLFAWLIQADVWIRKYHVTVI